MPLTPISEMTRWNNVLAYMHLDFIKRMIAMHLHKEHPDEPDPERVGARPKSRALPSHHGYSEEAQPETIHIGSETDGSVEILEDMDVTMTHPPLGQTCDLCPGGLQQLHRHQLTQSLFWACNNPRCALFRESKIDVELARGVFLCFNCQADEMIPINTTANPDETELECKRCGQVAYIFELPLVYSRMGRFKVDLLM